MPLFGYSVLSITFILAIYAIVSAIYGERTHQQKWIESARRAMLVTFKYMGILKLVTS